MPDFGFWSWPETAVGGWAEARGKAITIEAPTEDGGEGWGWARKEEKLLWRGATMGLAVRDRLVNVTAGKEWADVETLDWRDKESLEQDLLGMHEHCRFKYLAHTEGNSYSGRLKYLQQCSSVVVTHPQVWETHYSHLLRAAGRRQNFVNVRRDWGDLEAAIERLKMDDGFARRVADNSVQMFRDRYLTPAAEVCYWRRLFEAWREVSFEPEFYTNSSEGEGRRQRGVPWESYMLERRLEWDPY
ncbi:hypothetical protein M8818_003077 [Zalaria obscura]|uniref:Uncharacterized protein n=1 Tax=Zalaria obscura TaxID=2024903 RepID=A0ACC3SFW3_9PEZI